MTHKKAPLFFVLAVALFVIAYLFINFVPISNETTPVDSETITTEHIQNALTTYDTRRMYVLMNEEATNYLAKEGLTSEEKALGKIALSRSLARISQPIEQDNRKEDYLRAYSLLNEVRTDETVSDLIRKIAQADIGVLFMTSCSNLDWFEIYLNNHDKENYTRALSESENNRQVAIFRVIIGYYDELLALQPDFFIANEKARLLIRLNSVSNGTFVLSEEVTDEIKKLLEITGDQHIGTFYTNDYFTDYSKYVRLLSLAFTSDDHMMVRKEHENAIEYFGGRRESNTAGYTTDFIVRVIYLSYMHEFFPDVLTDEIITEITMPFKDPVLLAKAPGFVFWMTNRVAVEKSHRTATNIRELALTNSTIKEMLSSTFGWKF